MSIYVNYAATDLRDFLRKFFSYEADGTLFKSVATFRNKECTVLQCGKNRFRSFDDLLTIVQTYYPDVDHRELLQTLLTLDIKGTYGDTLHLHMGTCSGIERIRVCYTDIRSQMPFEQILGSPSYRSRWSWGELLEEIGLDTEEKYLNFIKNKS